MNKHLSDHLNSNTELQSTRAIRPKAVILQDGAALPACVVEMTRVELKLGSPLRPFQFVTLSLQSDELGAGVTTAGIVHWSRAVEHEWQAGVFLAQPVPAHFSPLGLGERRAELRYHVDVDAEIILGGATLSFPVQIVDYSVSGVCIRSLAPIRAGETARLFVDAHSRGRLSLTGTVVWSNELETCCLTGLTFDHEQGRLLAGVGSPSAEPPRPKSLGRHST